MFSGINKVIPFIFLALCILGFSGCSTLNPDASTDPAPLVQNDPGAAPYYPTGVTDIQVPGELEFKRENSMFINTASFAGGFLNFEGRVEINSLTDFFIATMEKHGWKNSGSVRYKNVLLAFVRPNKTCMVSMVDPGFGQKTQVYIYITEDMETQQTIRSDAFVR